MINNSLQGDLQEAIRNALNCANSYEGDLYALCNLYGVADGAVSGRLIPVAQKHSPTIGTASGALNYLLQNPTVLPSLGLNFVDGTDRLDSRITFTRSSNAWYFNSAGVLTQATTNTPRFDYNPVTLAPRGLLIEEQRTNLLTYSDQFDNAAWTKARATITANVVYAPDGTTTADKLVEDTTATNTHLTRQVLTVTANTTYTFSVFLKAGERTVAFIQSSDNATDTNGFFVTADLSAGTLSNGNKKGSGTYTSSSIASAGNGWYRVSVTGVVDATTTSVRYEVFLSNGSTTAYTGNGTSGIYIWGAQLEAGAFATSYIPTTTAAATRAADVAVMTGTNFSSWYNQTEGTLFADFSFAAVYATAPSAAFSVDDSTVNNLIILRTNTAHTQYGATATISTTNLTNVNSVALGSTSANASLKEAIAYKSGDSMLCGAGTLGTASTTAFSSGLFTAARIGNNYVNNQPLNGWVRRIAYYPRRLANAELQGITA